MISNSRFRNILFPSLFAITLVIFWFYFVKKTTFGGLSNVLESIITFSSIIIGFYTAMYGVIITFIQSDKKNIFDRMSDYQLEDTFKFQLYFSLLTSFIALILSIIMQSELINLNSAEGTLLFYLWLFSTFMLFIVSGITMSFLIRLIFAKQAKPRERTKI
ncbi:hypothetical protein [Leuconostoc mesenteroides]|uniref:hypothetical protein n=1 Tax=Leuconostoc mesenteroides TaxID=1245 RepID=UPI00224781E7|nr:hypothetical protein [Leuconostoc mesenteroides]MCX2666058.1 hypothetical protein [Leuconostoc mesenteroides subsp. mesenteroides]